MCDSSNAAEIVQEMLIYLKQADFAIREELVSIINGTWFLLIIFIDFYQSSALHPSMELFVLYRLCCSFYFKGIENCHFG